MTTILDAFIAEKLAAFEAEPEPTRRGTPRGEPIGFPKAKRKAAVLSLKPGDVQKMAADLGTSYGLVRKWRSEEVFKEFRNELWLAFTSWRQRYLQDMARSLAVSWSQHLRGGLEQIKGKLPPDHNKMVVSNLDEYPKNVRLMLHLATTHADIAAAISAGIEEVIGKDLDEPAKAAVAAAIRGQLGMLDPLLAGADPASRQQWYGEICRQLWDFVRGTLVNPEASEMDRKIAVTIAYYLERLEAQLG